MQTLIKEHLASICPDPIIGVDRRGVIVLFNAAAEQLLEYSAAEVVGEVNIGDLYHPREAGRFIKKLMYSGGQGRIQGNESALKSKSGRVVPIQVSATLIQEQGEEVGSIGFFHDLTARKQLEASLRTLSITDNLTGLYNQRHFHNILTQEIERSRRYGHALALVCIDMDDFKQVNDSLGHLQGDNLIAHLGQLIRDQLRRADFGFRYGGDEFMLILPETSQQEAITAAERLRISFAQSAPEVLQHDLAADARPRVHSRLTLSVGVTLCAAKIPPDELIRQVDRAMYQAKGCGGNRVILAGDPDAS